MRGHPANPIGTGAPVPFNPAPAPAGIPGIRLRQSRRIRAPRVRGPAVPVPKYPPNDCAALLTPERIRCQEPVTSKKRALQLGAGLLADGTATSSPGAIFDALIARERLGSTSLDNGVALPHARMPGLEAPVAACITLGEAVDFDAPEHRFVDILFVVLLPPDHGHEHMRTLTNAFRRPGIADALRACTGSSDLQACLATRYPERQPATVNRILHSRTGSGPRWTRLPGRFTRPAGTSRDTAIQQEFFLTA